MSERRGTIRLPARDIVIRMYDYLLGGKDNYAADRVAAEAMLKIYPDTGSSDCQ